MEAFSYLGKSCVFVLLKLSLGPRGTSTSSSLLARLFPVSLLSIMDSHLFILMLWFAWSAQTSADRGSSLCLGSM